MRVQHFNQFDCHGCTPQFIFTIYHPIYLIVVASWQSNFCKFDNMLKQAVKTKIRKKNFKKNLFGVDSPQVHTKVLVYETRNTIFLLHNLIVVTTGGLHAPTEVAFQFYSQLSCSRYFCNMKESIV